MCQIRKFIGLFHLLTSLFIGKHHVDDHLVWRGGIIDTKMIRCSRVFSDNGQKNYRIASGMRIFYRMGCVTTGFCSSVAINSVVLPLIKVENEYGWLLLLLLLRAVDVSNTSEMCIRVSLYPVLENLICIEKKMAWNIISHLQQYLKISYFLHAWLIKSNISRRC